MTGKPRHWSVVSVCYRPGGNPVCAMSSGPTEGTSMTRSRSAALVTWAYAAMFGAPAVPVAIFLAEQGRLPSLWGLFDM